MWLECAGNSRTRFDPPAEGNPWSDGAVSNAAFTGTPLRGLLELAGVQDRAVEVVTTGADSPEFQRGLPLGVALRPEVLLAWQINGQPIPMPNGGPVRLIVPRWAGIASVKWPIHLQLVDRAFEGYYNHERYVYVDADGARHGPVRQMPVKAVIAWPTESAVLPPGRHRVFGYAWSGSGPITSVEVSLEGQAAWGAAQIMPGAGPLAWTRWEFDWTVEQPGRATLVARATDAAGNIQPPEAAWNRFGYAQNSQVRRTVQIRA
jgi:DMSO/TMAO reductase YedYZ molybdopterin-dependent catalytic subunit